MNEPPGARARVGLTALTVAEYFRDEMNMDVMLFIDNIFRFTRQVGSFGTSGTYAFGGWLSAYFGNRYGRAPRANLFN